ncbi:MAG: hypothetical protein MH825_15965 [Cyanobacteria bacterium]|nr:hypothetical protein [Cyanobacteriota bacterium]
MNWILGAMVLATLIPMYAACQNQDIWQKMLAFASIATKTSVAIIVISVLQDDWFIGMVGSIILSVGNASLMLLAQVLKRLNQTNPGY